MTGRFGNLEFGEERERREEPESLAPTGTPQPTPEGYLRAAEEDYHWGRFETALRLYTRCLQEQRAMVPAWVGQVQMLVYLGEYHEARVWADKALELFRAHGDLLAAKAQACVRLGDRRAAYACSDASMQASGSSAFRWQTRGEVLLANREKTYEACFKRSLTEPETDWFDRVSVACIFLFYHRAASALSYADQAVQMSPESGYAWFVLGRCQWQLGIKPLAVGSFSRCLEIRPDYAEARRAIMELDQEPFVKRLVRRLFGRR